MKYPKMPNTTITFFAQEQWNYQSYKSKFSNLFRRARQAVGNQGPVNINMPTALMMQVRNRNPLLRSAGNPFGDDDNCLSTMILQSVRPKGPNCLPKSSPIITQMAEGQQSEVETEFCLNGEADYCNAAAFFERQHIAPSLGGHTQLLHFENEVGLRAFVCKHFEGSYPRFTYFASMYTSPPGAMWEKGLARAFFQFYHLANEQIDSISPTVRSQLMVIGDGTGSRILTRITQGANEVTDIVDELVGESADDNMEDGGIRAAELKQRYEKLPKTSSRWWAAKTDRPMPAGPTCSGSTTKLSKSTAGSECFLSCSWRGLFKQQGRAMSTIRMCSGGIKWGARLWKSA